MSITALYTRSSARYSAQQTASRTIEVIDKDQPLGANTSPQQLKAVLVEFSSIALSQSRLQSTHTDTDEATENEPDQPEMAPELFKTKLILEKMFGFTTSIMRFEQLPDSIKDKKSSASDNDETRTVTIDGQNFLAGDQLLITEISTSSQQLNYQTSGTFVINGKDHLVSYQLELSEKRVSLSQTRSSAEQLKDPLLVQYGDIAIGQLNGQSASIDVNGDDKIDQLPMFNGNVGYLVFDKNGNAKADNGSELFGPQTGAGFNELSALDTNNNGFVDREDDNFSDLYLWQIDSAGNNSWIALSDTNIEGISLNATATPFNFYDQDDQLQARLTQTSIAITDTGRAYGVHQIDIRI